MNEHTVFDCPIANTIDERLNHLHNQLQEIRDQLVNNRIDIARLQIKAGIYGAIGAAIPTAIAATILVLK